MVKSVEIQVEANFSQLCEDRESDMVLEPFYLPGTRSRFQVKIEMVGVTNDDDAPEEWHVKLHLRRLDELPLDVDVVYGWKDSGKPLAIKGLPSWSTEEWHPLGLRSGELLIEKTLGFKLDFAGEWKWSMPATKFKDGRLTTDFKALLDSGEHTDVTLRVGEQRKEFRAHFVVLAARSPVFAGMLKAPMQEALQKEVEILDIDPEVFQAVLHHLYSGELPGLEKPSRLEFIDLLLGILKAAHRYELHGLIEECVEELSQSMADDTVAATLDAAYLLNLPELKSECMHFVRQNPHGFQNTEAYHRLAATRPEAMKDILAMFYPPNKRQRR